MISRRSQSLFVVAALAACPVVAPARAQTLDVSSTTNAPAQPLQPLQPLAPQTPTIGSPAPITTLTPSVLTPADPNQPPPPPTVHPSGIMPYLPNDPRGRQGLREMRRRPTPTDMIRESRTIATQETVRVEAPARPDQRVVEAKLTSPLLFNNPEADRILSEIEWFPADNLWNRNVSDWPTHQRSSAIIASIGATRWVSCNYDMGFILVPPNQTKVPVRITAYASESDPGPYPIPSLVPIEGWPLHPQGATLSEVQQDLQQRGGDRHAIVLDPTNLLLYEFFMFRKTDAGWEAGQASVFDLKTNRLRPDGWTSADAAGLPILPGVVRYDELAAGLIDHALRVTVPRTQRAYVAPATHFASRLTDENLPRMGERLRLRRDFDLRDFSPAARTILVAMQQHGLFVADNGNLFAISIAPDDRIPDLAKELAQVQAADFEVVVAPD